MWIWMGNFISTASLVTPPLTHVEILRPRDATELNNDGTIRLGDEASTTKQNRIYHVSVRDLINDSSFQLSIRIFV